MVVGEATVVTVVVGCSTIVAEVVVMGTTVVGGEAVAVGAAGAADEQAAAKATSTRPGVLRACIHKCYEHQPLLPCRPVLPARSHRLTGWNGYPEW